MHPKKMRARSSERDRIKERDQADMHINSNKKSPRGWRVSLFSCIQLVIHPLLLTFEIFLCILIYFLFFFLSLSSGAKIKFHMNLQTTDVYLNKRNLSVTNHVYIEMYSSAYLIS